MAAAALLAGCGGGDGSESSSSAPLADTAMRAPAGPLAASVSVEAAANQLMDLAESTPQYKQFFPEHQVTLTNEPPFLYRHYSNGTNLGVVVTQNPFYPLNGVYTLGGPLGGLTYQGQVEWYLPPPPVTGNRTLRITVSATGIPPTTIDLPNVPMPTSQGEFCSGLTSDTTFTQIAAGVGGTMTINSCSFSGSSGNIAATLTVTSPFAFQFSYNITYTYL
jgi:hypothetical protein